MRITRYSLVVCTTTLETVRLNPHIYSPMRSHQHSCNIAFINRPSAEFRSYFERFGRVMSAEVMFNRETHKSRGFGFIVFELEKGAEQVCGEKEHVIDGKVVSTLDFERESE